MIDNTNRYGIITRLFGDIFTCRKYKKLKCDVEDLLNTIHCDNNHFTNTRGHKKSCNEAKRIVIEYQKQLGLHRHD
jgi:hypothetical protein